MALHIMDANDIYRFVCLFISDYIVSYVIYSIYGVNLIDVYNVCLTHYRSTNFISNGGQFSGFGLSLHSTEVSASSILAKVHAHEIL